MSFSKRFRPSRRASVAAVVAAAAVLAAVAVVVPAFAAPAATPPAVKTVGAPAPKPAARPASKPATKPAPKPSAAALRAANIRAGGTLFGQFGCGACHTLAAARAAGTAGPNLDVLGLPGAEIAGQLTRGSIAMPSFRTRLTVAQISQLARYVAASSRAGTSRPRDARTLFVGYCGSCHVLQAAGSRGAVSVSLDAKRYTDQQVISALVTQHPLSMGFGVHFSEVELPALAAYVAGAASSAAAPPATTTTTAPAG